MKQLQATLEGSGATVLSDTFVHGVHEVHVAILNKLNNAVGRQGMNYKSFRMQTINNLTSSLLTKYIY